MSTRQFKENNRLVLLILAIVILTISYCGGGDGDGTPGIEYHYMDICLNTEDGNVANCDTFSGSSSFKSASADNSPLASKAPPADLGLYKLNYLARILPPFVDGNYVQSNAVLLAANGNQAYIAYNTAGNAYRGAIQIVDINTGKMSLVINKEFQFPDMDINSLYLDGDILFFGAVGNPDTHGDAATFTGHINVKNPESIEIIRANMTALNLNPGLAAVSSIGSYSVTGISGTNNYYYISVGAGFGGILRVSKTLVSNKLNIASAVFTSYTDVRSIIGYKTNIYALEGTDQSSPPMSNGQILYNSESGVWASLPIINFGSPENKATIDLYKDPLKSENGLIFLGLSEAGLKIMSMADSNGALTDVVSIANPLITNPALYPNLKTNTNSASYDSDLIFSANGNYGFRVFQNQNKGSITNSNFQIVGYHNMQGLTYGGVEYSANDVAYRNKTILVAAGQGGVCVYLLLDK